MVKNQWSDAPSSLGRRTGKPILHTLRGLLWPISISAESVTLALGCKTKSLTRLFKTLTSETFNPTSDCGAKSFDEETF